MQVTEYNISDWKLNLGEMNTLISLIKQEMKYNENNQMIQNYYGTILGKLLIMRYDCASSDTGTEEITITDL